MVDNVQIAQQLLAVQERMRDILEAQSGILKDQLGLIQSVTDAASANAPASGGIAGQILNTRKALFDAGAEAETTGQKFLNSMTKGAKGASALTSKNGDLANSLSKLGKAAPVAAMFGIGEALSSIASRMGTTLGIGKSIVGLFGQIASSAFNIGLGILSIPFRIFSGMIQLAGELAQQYKHIAEAFEGFRQQFGAFTNEAGLALKEGLATAKQMGDLGGLGFFSVFQDTSGAIKFFQETFVSLGSLMDAFGREIGQMGDKFVYLSKGMGLSTDDMKVMATVAKTFGRTLENVLGEVSNMTLQMEKQFGISNKSLAKNVASMMGNVRTFGNASVKSLTATAIRVRSLGLEMEVVDKIVDKFMNFEEAATSASRLSQAFGMNLDAIGLMNAAAKDQGKLIDNLRNSFFAAGRDASKMGTAELRLLASTTGLSEQEARLMFSMENRGKSLEEIKKQSEKAGNAELSQAEIMSKLADAIERVIRVFQYKSFFGAFIDGFGRGVKMAAPFMGTLMNLQGALDRTREAGEAVGRLFVSEFPGVLDMLTALSETFNSKNFSEMKKKLIGTFKTMFEDVGKLSPQEAMQKFWYNLKDTFGLVSKQQSETLWGPLQDGFFKFLDAIGKIITGSIPLIKDQLIVAIKKFSGLLRGEFTGQTGEFVKAGEDVGSRVWDTFLGPIWEALKVAWKDPEFQKSLDDLMGEIGNLFVMASVKLGKFLMDNPKISLTVLGGLTAIMAGPAIVSGLVSAGATLGGLFLGAVLSWVGTVPLIIGAAIATSLAGAFALATGSVAISNGIDEFGETFSSEFESGTTAKLAAAVAGIAKAVSFGYLSNEQSESVGRWVGQLRDSFMEKIRDFPIVGSTLSEFLTGAMSTSLDSFKAIGHLITDIFKGEINPETFKELGSAIGKAFYFNIKTVLKTIPKLFAQTIALSIGAIIKFTPQIVQVFFKGLSVLTSFMSGIASQIPLVGEPLSKFLDSGSEGFAKFSDFMGRVSDAWKGIIETVTSDDFSLKGAFFKALDYVKDNIYPKVLEVSTAILDGLKDGLLNLSSVMSDSFSAGLLGVKDFLGINSPSSVFRDEIGFNMGEGIIEGLSKSLFDVPQKVMSLIGTTDVVGAVTRDTSTALESIAAQVSDINGSLAKIPEIDVPLKIEKVGKVLGIKDNTLTIETKPVNVTVNVVLTVEADKIAQVLLDTKKFVPK